MNKKTKIIAVSIASLLALGALTGITYKIVNNNNKHENSNTITTNSNDFVVYIYKSEDGIEGTYTKSNDKFTIKNYTEASISNVNDLAITKFDMNHYTYNKEMTKVDYSNKTINVYYYKTTVKTYTVTGLGSADKTNIKSYIGNNGEYLESNLVKLSYDVTNKKIITPFDTDFNFSEYMDRSLNEMIEIPTFYKKIEKLDSLGQITSYTISRTKIDENYLPYPCFIKHDGTIASFIGVGKYRSCIKKEKLASKSLASSTYKNNTFETYRKSISAYDVEGQPQSYSGFDIWTLQLFRDLFTVVFSDTTSNFYKEFGTNVLPCSSQSDLLVTDFYDASDPFCLVADTKVENVYHSVLFNICDFDQINGDYIEGLIYQNDLLNYQLDYSKYSDWTAYTASRNLPYYDGTGNIKCYKSDPNCPFLNTVNGHDSDDTKYYTSSYYYPMKGHTNYVKINNLYSFEYTQFTSLTLDSFPLPRLIQHEV